MISLLRDVSVDIKKTWDFLDGWISAKESQISSIRLDCGFETIASLKVAERSSGWARKVARKVMDVLKTNTGPAQVGAWFDPS